MDFLITILFVFWVYMVFKRPPKFKNVWFLFNSNRRLFNKNRPPIKESISREIQHKIKNAKNIYK